MSDELYWKYMKLGGGEVLGDPDPANPLERVEQDSQGLVVRYRDFQRGTLYWTSETGVSVIVEEKIWRFWQSLDPQDKMMLGHPMSDTVPDHRGRFYNKFQGGTIYYNPYQDTCEAHYNGRSSRDNWRMISIGAALGLWLIVAIIVAVSNSDEGMFHGNAGLLKGFVAVVTLLVAPLTALVLGLVWKSTSNDDGS